MEEKQTSVHHKLVMNDRKTMHLGGVLDVISFDVKEVLLETTEGMLTIKGSDLHIHRLLVEKGELEVEGRVDALLYSDVLVGKHTGEALLKRLFK